MYKKYLVFGFIGICLLMISIGIIDDRDNVTAHESVHRQIDLYFGCRNVTMNVTWFDGGSTTCNDENQTFIPEQEAMHSFNEVISYNDDGIINAIRMSTLFIVAMFFIIAYVFFMKWEEEPPIPRPPKPSEPPRPPLNQ